MGFYVTFVDVHPPENSALSSPVVEEEGVLLRMFRPVKGTKVQEYF